MNHRVQSWSGETLYTQQLDPRVRIEKPSSKPAWTTVPSLHFALAFGEALWVTKKAPEKETWELWKKSPQEDWSRVGSLDSMSIGGHVEHIYPLGNGRFLLIPSVYPFMAKKNEFHCLALAKLEKENRFEPEAYFDFPEPRLPHFKQYPRDKAPGFRWGFTPEATFLQQMLLDGLVHCGDCYLAISRGTGYIYVLNQRDGAVRRVAKLFPKVSSHLDQAEKELEWPILAVQPTQEGKLLIVSRTEEAVFQARKSFPITGGGLDGPSPGDPKKWIVNEGALNRQADSLKAFPELLYWSFDPDTGEFTSLARPEGMPDKLWDLKMAKGFAFELSYDGKWIYTGETAQAPKAPEKPKAREMKAPTSPTKAITTGPRGS